MTTTSITVQQAQEKLSQGALLIDIRSPGEYNYEHIEQAQNRPTDVLRHEKIIRTPGQAVIFHCGSGTRTRIHATALASSVEGGSGDIYLLKGGLGAWKSAGFPTIAGAKQPIIEVARQVQICAGSLVVIGVLLGAFVSPWFYLLSFFVGAGLIFAGITGFCGMAVVLQKMPWNQPHSKN